MRYLARNGLWVPAPLELGTGRRRTSAIIRSRKGHSGFVNPGAGGAGGPAGDPPYLPGGLSPVYEHDFNIATAAEIQTGAALGTGWYTFDHDSEQNGAHGFFDWPNVTPAPTYVAGANGEGNLTFTNGGPGDASYLRMRYPTNWPAGYEPAMVGWEPSLPGPDVQYSEIFSRVEFLVEDGSGTGANNFEQQRPVGQKLLGFWGVGRPGGTANEIIGEASRPGSPDSQFVNAMKMQVYTQNVSTRNLDPNVVSDFWVTVGVRHVFDLHMVLNSAINVSDGIIEWWGDGQLKGRYTDLLFMTTTDSAGNPVTYNRGFYGRKYDPTYGGAGIYKSRMDYVRTYHEKGWGVLR